MEITSEFVVHKTTRSRLSEVDFNDIPFGKHISDHMLVCDFSNGEWHNPQIVPFTNLSMSPATLALHYGQSVFEGMKAFHMEDGRINIFRIQKHYERLVKSLTRMCMAIVPEDIFTEALIWLVDIDRQWVPESPGSALYLRPFVYASEAKFGLHVSSQYRLVIFSGPVGEYYSEPIKVKVETHFSRAARGGTGYAKCAGNYAGSLYPTKIAKQGGYDQVLWTDAKEHEFIEESGMMNAMFVINGKLITPPLSDSILDGITRDSLLTLARDLGLAIEERPISVSEIRNAFYENTITEAFGTGTAAVVAPIEIIGIDEMDYHLPAYSHENLMIKLKKELEDIRIGKLPDRHRWNFVF